MKALATPEDFNAYEPHPYAELFPLMQPDEFEDLKADIAAHGQRERILVAEGMILDGRNRYRACRELGVTPDIRFWQSRLPPPRDYVISINLHRRHLSPSQRAAVATEIATIGNGGDRRSDQSANLHFEKTIAEAASDMNVSVRSVKTAREVKANAEPEVFDAVKSGGISVSAAAKLAKLPPDDQRAIAASNDPKSAAKSTRPKRPQALTATKLVIERLKQAIAERDRPPPPPLILIRQRSAHAIC